MRPRSAYSGWKIAFHPDVLAALRAGRLCRPVHLQLHLTARCNLACRHCINGGVAPRIRCTRTDELPRPFVERVLDDFAELGGAALELTGGGEPTLHPEFFEVVDGALDRGLRVALVTNGVLDDEGRELLAEVAPRLAWIRVSLDALCAEDFGARKGGPPDAFARALATVRALAEAKANVGISYLVDGETSATEVAGAAGLAGVLGARSIRFAPIYKESTPTRVRSATRAELANLAVQDYLVVDMLPRRSADVAARHRHPDRECGYMYTSTVVAADRCVYPCCFLAYSRAHVLADLDETTFAAWWRSEERAARLRHWRRAVRCDGVACWARDKNDVFYRLVRDIPADLDFI